MLHEHWLKTLETTYLLSTTAFSILSAPKNINENVWNSFLLLKLFFFCLCSTPHPFSPQSSFYFISFFFFFFFVVFFVFSAFFFLCFLSFFLRVARLNYNYFPYIKNYILWILLTVMLHFGLWKNDLEPPSKTAPITVLEKVTKGITVYSAGCLAFLQRCCPACWTDSGRFVWSQTGCADLKYAVQL